MPTFDEYNQVIEDLLQSLKYIKFNQLVLRLIEKFFKMLGNWFEKLISGFSRGQTSNSGSYLLQGIFVFLAILAILGLVIFIIKYRKKKKKKLNTILGEKIEKSTTVLTLQEKSRELEAQGAYRESVRFRYIAVLLHLHQKSILYHDASMTGMEMIEKLKKDKFVATNRFDEITQGFNGIWYGMHELDAGQFSHWVSLENNFWQEATQ